MIARRLSHWVVANPYVYDLVQRLAGCEHNLTRIAVHLDAAPGQLVCDVGGGTGAVARTVPPGATYLCLDKDPEKLAGLKRKIRNALAILGDATRIGVKDGCVDVVVCAAMSHHLTDDECHNLFAELARVCRGHLVFFDAVERPGSTVSRLLWKYDRGSHPRPADSIVAMMAKWFYIEHREEYAIYHRYVLCVGRPKCAVARGEERKP